MRLFISGIIFQEVVQAVGMSSKEMTGAFRSVVMGFWISGSRRSIKVVIVKILLSGNSCIESVRLSYDLHLAR
ncbi:MAG TPA: hypothetical protein VLH15_00895 [Dehalococcoidales bacterium]|nr:hypothetical protein [Dehalococcoidales bacterium]